MNYIGLDIHKKSTQACVMNDKGKVLMNVRFLSDSKEINEFLDKITPLGAVSVVMEATGFCMYIYDIIEAAGHDVKVAHPSKIKALTADRAKTDKNDAEMLAELLRLNAIPESYIPPKELRELRELTRFRQSLVWNSASIKNQIHAILAMRGIKVPPNLRSPFSKKHVRWLRSLDIVQLGDLLDMMELVLKRARYPLRRSRYANRLYTDHQHVVLLALRQHFRKSYRDFCEEIEVCTLLLDELGLRRVPHWTTLHKFSRRANTRRLERLLLAYLDEARVRVLHLAVDSTGFSPTSASTYYVRTLKRREGKPGRPRNRREMSHYLKQTVAAETRKQLIVAVKFRRGPANDSPDFIWTLKKVLPAERPVKIVRADKGYDAESNHQYAQEVLGARTVIPVRAASRPKVKMRGKRRRKMAKEWDDEEYHPRVKVETVFSVEKRVSGSHVLARVPSQQHKELIFRAFSYNSRRLESLFLLFIEDFYKAPY
jgi:hypothetical protein